MAIAMMPLIGQLIWAFEGAAWLAPTWTVPLALWNAVAFCLLPDPLYQAALLTNVGVVAAMILTERVPTRWCATVLRLLNG